MKEEYENEGTRMTDHDYHHKTKDPANSRHLPLDLLEPIATSADSDNDVLLPSFVDLQRKTIQTLYHHGDMLVDDKSPKGSVDGPIRPLVDLINRHSSYCTLSSCSGRISLFDPNGRHEGIQGSTTADSNNNNNNNTSSGKGTGGWLLVSHHPIESSELEACFPPVSANDASTTTNDGSDDASAATIIPWIFKLEPLLLHVAANSLPRGRQLLQLALELGFRESGLVISDARVTVAIRGHSLSLAVPLAPSGPLRPSNTNEFFLQALVTQANQRLIQNWYQLDRLYERIESNLFQVVVAAVTGDGGSGQVSSIVTSIPSLNLWNLAAVAIPASIAKDKTAMDVLVFGGYGTGPGTPGNHTSYTTARRSSDIYKLERRQNQWDTKWQRLVLDSPFQEEAESSTDTQQQLRIVEGLPDCCQGMGACLLKSKNWIVLWGGRTNPKNALGKDLFVLIPNVTTTTSSSSSTSTSTSSTRSYYSLGIPQDIRGTPPSPRWGHSLVALNESTLLVVGGCNHEEGALDDMYALHFCDEPSFVQWEKLSVSLPNPRFHHMAMIQDDCIFVFGGLTSTTQVLEPFHSSNTTKQQQHDFIWVGQVEQIDQNENGEMRTSVKVINDVESFREADLSGLNRFGGAVCCCCSSSAESLVVVSGGIAASNENDDEDDETANTRPLDVYFLSATNNCTSNKGKVTVAHVPILEYSAAKEEEEEETELDFGSLVHHSAVAIDSNEFLLLGGGVNAFAFGNSFAKSYHVRIELPAAALTKKNQTIEPAVSKSKKADTSFLDSSLQTKNKSAAMTFVVMVAPSTAKAVKVKLQAAGWLDKRYRMTKSSSSQSAQQQIAIPVTETGWNEIQNQLRQTTTIEWLELILDHGQQEMPYSTSQFAAKKKNKGKR